ncbi:hypothetical protein AVEN_35223-1 [Araneus ventricosus]|uniref:Uncharacterized protein n=1 Tax=Araneus ventricosus TaxID=182803 RepID=A0A4Y2WGT4_ARAVE|nr:hypothetical protein AVEN_35223-1 [Araneus ventricosus]
MYPSSNRKNPLDGQRFICDKKMQDNLEKWIRQQSKSFWRKVNHSLPMCGGTGQKGRSVMIERPPLLVRGGESGGGTAVWVFLSRALLQLKWGKIWPGGLPAAVHTCVVAKPAVYTLNDLAAPRAFQCTTPLTTCTGSASWNSV